MSTTLKTLAGTTPAGPYSPAVLAEGRFVYVSGQGPLTDGKPVSGTIEQETAHALANIATILEGAGAALSDVVRCGVFIADLSDLSGMNSAYAEAFGEHRPARTTVGAALPGIKVEIDCVALLPDA